MLVKLVSTEYLSRLVNFCDCRRNRKYLFLWLMILIGLLGLNFYFRQFFFIFQVYPESDVSSLSNRNKNPKMQLPGSNFSQYIIKTKNCKIPAFNPRDDKIKNIVKNSLRELNCGKPALTAIVNGQLVIQLNNLKYHKEEAKLNDINCCYQEITRINGSSDDEFKLSSSCTKILNGTLIVKEFIRVECTIINVTSTYINYHYTIPDPVFKNKLIHNGSFNVMFLGLDSISRLNFERHLPATRQYLIEKLKAVEMFGYTKIGDNTFPNLVAILMGVSEKELEENRWNEKKPFDDYTFLWNLFSKAGYQTMFGEDTFFLSTFNYFKEGFYQQPTDYYLRAFQVAAEKEIGNKRFMNTKLCLGPKPTHEVTLDYGKLFMEKMQNVPHFGFLWSNSLSHDDLNAPQLADNYLFGLLNDLHKKGHLQKTILFVLSDHGMRWGPILETTIGEYELRLPALYVYIPGVFQKQFPEHFEALKINSRRLTSPYDVYHTVVDILKISSNNLTFNESLEKQNSYGISFFEDIPDNRTCEDMGISYNWCACDETENVDTNNAFVESIALFIVDKINELTKKVRDVCALLTLKTIHSAYRQINAHSRNSLNQLNFYRLTIDVDPSEAIFEVTVKFHNKSKEITINEGDISRANLYGNQSSCVNQLEYKNFCFCI